MISLIEEAEQLIKRYEAIPEIMKPEQFEIIKAAIYEIGHRKAGKTMDAARLVLVDGRSRKSACEVAKANRGALSRLLSKFSAYKVCNHCRQAHKSKYVQTPISGA